MEVEEAYRLGDQTKKASLIRTVKLYNVNRSFIYGYSLQMGSCAP